jgi:hypothetical protein
MVVRSVLREGNRASEAMEKQAYVMRKEAPVSWFSDVENGYRESEKVSSKGANK